MGTEPLVALATNGSEISYDEWIETEFYLDCYLQNRVLVENRGSSDPNVADLSG